jgi:predicted nucleotidyltransferase
MNVDDVFRRIVLHLEQRNISYMLIGSFASTYYGASRSTRDVDIVIETAPEQLLLFIGDLQRDDYYAELEAALQAQKNESIFNIIDNKSGWKVDLITSKSRDFSREEFQRRRAITLSGIALSIASPEDVVISKLEWAKLAGSERQIEDAAHPEGAMGGAGRRIHATMGRRTSVDHSMGTCPAGDGNRVMRKRY